MDVQKSNLTGSTTDLAGDSSSEKILADIEKYCREKYSKEAEMHSIPIKDIVGHLESLDCSVGQEEVMKIIKLSKNLQISEDLVTLQSTEQLEPAPHKRVKSEITEIPTKSNNNLSIAQMLGLDGLKAYYAKRDEISKEAGEILKTIGASIQSSDIKQTLENLKMFESTLTATNLMEGPLDINKECLSSNDLEQRFVLHQREGQHYLKILISLAALNFIRYFSKYLQELTKPGQSELSKFFILRGPSGYGKSHALACFVLFERVMTKKQRILYINNPSSLAMNFKAFMIRELMYCTYSDQKDNQFYDLLRSFLTNFKIELSEDDLVNKDSTYGNLWAKVDNLIHAESPKRESLKALISCLTDFYRKKKLLCILIVDKAHIVYNHNQINHEAFEFLQEIVNENYFDSVILCASNNRIIQCSETLSFEDIELDFNPQSSTKVCDYYVYKEPFHRYEIVEYLDANLDKNTHDGIVALDAFAFEAIEERTEGIPWQLYHFCETAQDISRETKFDLENLIDNYEEKTRKEIRLKFAAHFTTHMKERVYYESLIACLLGMQMRQRPYIDKRLFYYASRKEQYFPTPVYEVYTINKYVRQVALEYIGLKQIQSLARQTFTQNEEELLEMFKTTIKNTSSQINRSMKGNSLECLFTLVLSAIQPMKLRYQLSKADKTSMCLQQIGELMIPECDKIYINELNIVKLFGQITQIPRSPKSLYYLLIPNVPNFPISDLWLVQIPQKGLIEVSLIQVTINIKDHKVKQDLEPNTKNFQKIMSQGISKESTTDAKNEATPKPEIKEPTHILSDKHIRKILQGESKCDHRACKALFNHKEKINCNFYWFTNESLQTHTKLLEVIHQQSRIIYLEENRSELFS